MKRRERRRGGQRAGSEQNPRRRSPHRSEKIRILIVGEGKETEPHYSYGLRNEEAVRETFIIDIRKGKGGSSLAVVQQAVAAQANAAARRRKFDEVRCVLDVEQAGQREQLIEARPLAARYGIRLVLSNPSFEVWLLAHFVRTKRSFADCAAVMDELNKYWRSEFRRDYEKNDEQLYARLKDRTETAVDNARKVRSQDWASTPDIVDCNSVSDVYLLVAHLLGAPG